MGSRRQELGHRTQDIGHRKQGKGTGYRIQNTSSGNQKPSSVSRLPSTSLNSVFRLIDANLNRSSEGLRVVEDIVRFIYGDEKYGSQLKSVRQRLNKVIKKYYPQLIQARDSDNDFGAVTKEKKRSKIEDILIANFRRAQESLRVLEEFGKLVSVRAGYEFKQLRFEIYTLEKEIVTKSHMVTSSHK